MSAKADSLKTIFLALGANFAIFLAKLFAAFVTGSGSMLAEAVHSLADCGNQGLLLLGMRHARRAASADHPLGYGMVLYFWSFLVALLLFSVGGMFSIYEGIHKFETHEPLRWPWLAVGVLAFGIVAESFSMWGCMREVNKARVGKSLWRFMRDGQPVDVPVDGNIRANDVSALARAAVEGAGIAMLPTYLAADDIAAGRLRPILASFPPEELGIYGVYASRRQMPLILRSMLDFLAARLESAPWDAQAPRPARA